MGVYAVVLSQAPSRTKWGLVPGGPDGETEVFLVDLAFFILFFIA